MSDSHKYYYIKIKENFFNNPKIILIKNGNKDNGDAFINLLIMMYLLSLKYNGALMYTEDRPMTTEELTILTGYPEEMVQEALSQFCKYNLIEVMPDGCIYMQDIQECIGNSSTEADRKRRYRAEIKQRKLEQDNDGQNKDERPPEIERKTEIEKKKESESDGRIQTCPICGESLIEKVLNGKLAWCHEDGYRPSAKCKAIFNSVAEIKGYSENPTGRQGKHS